jgi:ribosomal protein L37AE/L43A
MEDEEREYEAEDGYRCPVCHSTNVSTAENFFWCNDCPHAGDLNDLLESDNDNS